MKTFNGLNELPDIFQAHKLLSVAIPTTVSTEKSSIFNDTTMPKK
jgi:hypothetical protein